MNLCRPLLNIRINLISPGNIYSKEWAMKNVLKMTDIDIQDEKSKIEKEQEAEAPPEGEDDDTGQF